MTRDEYREAAIVWLHRQREYEDMAKNSIWSGFEFWHDMAHRAELKVQLYASVAGLESIEEMKE